MTPFTTPIFDFHLVTSPLTTPLTTPTPTPTPSLVKTSLKKASAVDPENWVGLLIDRAQGKSASANQKHYPDLGSDTTDTSMKFLPRLFLTDVISQGNQWWHHEML